jgi:hypothetical protein
LVSVAGRCLMSRRRVLTMAVATLALFACLNIAFGMLWLPAIPNHRGDGSFQDLSRRAGPFAVPGYSISMPEFDLAKPHEAEYQIAGLANIDRECGVHLAIRDHDGRWWGDTSQLGGKVQIGLVDTDGHVILSLSGRLGDFTWWRFSDLHALYQMDKSFFNPVSAKEYRLRFTYEPDPQLAGYKGFVYIRSGGNK